MLPKNTHYWIVAGFLIATAIVYYSIEHTSISVDLALTHKPIQQVQSEIPAIVQAPSFSDETYNYGIFFAHRQGDETLTGLDEVVGPGACVIDYNNDGWMDLFLVNGAGDTRYYGKQHWWQHSAGHALYKNIQGRRFEDTTAKAGIKNISSGMGCLAVDLDNDKFEDILISNNGSLTILKNNRGETFSDVSSQSGIVSPDWNTSIAVADIDNDGLLDIYVSKFIAFKKGAHTYEPASQFKQDIPPSFNPVLYGPLPNQLYRNLGNMTFSDISVSSNTTNADGRTLSAAWIDINDDRLPDLFVANAPGNGSVKLYLNGGNLRFTDVGLQSHIESAKGFRNFNIGDIDNDGVFEILATSFSGASSSLFTRKGIKEKTGYVYIDEARTRGFASESSSTFSNWASGIYDFNNDGWNDIFIVNSIPLPDPDAPRVTIGQRKQVWINTGNGYFKESIPPLDSPLADNTAARGAAFADFNNDGKIDVYIANNNDVGQLLINRTNDRNAWLGIALRPTSGNTNSVGATVAITTDRGVFYRSVSKNGFLSSNDNRIHIGLGTASVINGMSITWTNGEKVDYKDVPINTYIDTSQTGQISKQTYAQTTPKKFRLQLSIGESQAKNRADYLEILATISGIDAAFRELDAARQDPDENVRIKAIEILSREKSNKTLAALIQSLSDRNDVVRAQALSAICSYESEYSIRWLLHSRNDASALVRESLANCFRNYYREEEAVIHRKYLALPTLIEFLRDKNKNVRIASIRTLAEAERFRGVHPLNQLLIDVDIDIRIETIRALGLIRDKEALSVLQNLITKTNLDYTEYGNLFISLKRLDSPDLETKLSNFIVADAAYKTLPLRTRIKTLAYIAKSEEGLVFAPDYIGRLLSQLAPDVYLNQNSDIDLVVDYIRSLRLNRNEKLVSILDNFLSHGDERVRVEAFLALIDADNINRTNWVIKALNDESMMVKNSALEASSNLKTTIPDPIIITLINNEATRKQALKSVSRQRVKYLIDVLVPIVHQFEQDEETVMLALSALSTGDINFDLPNRITTSASDQIRLSAFRYNAARYQNKPITKMPEFIRTAANDSSFEIKNAMIDFLLQRDEYWAKQMVISLLDSKNPDTELRRAVSKKISLSYLEKSNIIDRIIGDRQEQIRQEIIEKIVTTNNPIWATKKKNILLDQNEISEVRIKAARTLLASENITTDNKEILDILRGMATR